MICILGGTFDPVHFGHLRAALDVQQALDIPCVHLLPCREPPHRSAPLASPGQRLDLLRLVVADEPALEVDSRELNREGPSYMVDTLESLRTERGDEAVCLALGMDAFAGLESWHRWQDLRALCHFVVMQRPGSQWPARGVVGEWVRQGGVAGVDELHRRPSGCIVGVPVTQMDISSTRIRALLASGRSARYLAPDAVLDWIQQEKWYANR
jgi:nicotinate-nucleotide adenylyltransferase